MNAARNDEDVPAPETWGDRWVEDFVPVRTPGDTVERLEVSPGRIHGRVRDRTGQRMDVTVGVEPFSDEDWQRLVERLASRLRYATDLLAGRIPPNIEDIAEDVGVTLFPTDIDVTCDCGSAPSCSHASGVHRSYGEALIGDPSQLLALRGRDREELVMSLRAVRAGAEPKVVARRTEQQSTSFEDVDPDRLFESGGDLAGIRLHPRSPEDPAALLRRLGEPPHADDTEPFERLVEVAADTAWRLAAGEGAEAADDELLLAELRARGMATGRDVAEALGWPVDRTQRVLDRLFEEGAVMRAGAGPDAKYRA